MNDINIKATICGVEISHTISGDKAQAAIDKVKSLIKPPQKPVRPLPRKK